MRELGLRASEAAIDGLFVSFDQDCSGYVDYHELQAALKQQPPEAALLIKSPLQRTIRRGRAPGRTLAELFPQDSTDLTSKRERHASGSIASVIDPARQAVPASGAASKRTGGGVGSVLPSPRTLGEGSTSPSPLLPPLPLPIMSAAREALSTAKLQLPRPLRRPALALPPDVGSSTRQRLLESRTSSFSLSLARPSRSRVGLTASQSDSSLLLTGVGPSTRRMQQRLAADSEWFRREVLAHGGD